jgi:uncharacterized protein YqjF (DUF2071 family)
MEETSVWLMQPQDQEGEYFFSGAFYATRGIQERLSEIEILELYRRIQQLVREKKGLDYLVVFKHKQTAEKLFFIDQLNKKMIASGGFRAEDNHCTLLLAEEY